MFKAFLKAILKNSLPLWAGLVWGFLFPLASFSANITLADPTIFYEDGVYYLTGTLDGNGFRMYTSTDLVRWTPAGNATGGLALHKDDVFGTSSFWAPQIVKHNNRYYIAYAANEQIGIAVADNPAGPYRSDSKKEISHTTGQIDPFIFVDDDGKAYLYYVRFTGGNELWVAELNSDWTDVRMETLTRCLGADDNTWEHRRNYSNNKVTEGPTVIKDGDYYYLLYSANDFRDIDYAVGYAYSRSPKGPWTKVGRPFLSRHNTGINGSGHGDLFRTAEGELYYVFHVHASNTNNTGTRRTAIVPVTMTDDPQNKFVPDVGRMYLLTDNATSFTTLPTAPLRFQAEGMSFEVVQGKYAQLSYLHPVLFGGYEGTVEVPSEVDYDGKTYTINAIGPNAFYNCPDLRKVILPESIKKLDLSAFESCGLRSITVPSGVTSIGYRCFADNANLLDVVMQRDRPVNISAGTFSSATLASGKLWVPEGSTETYQANAQWAEFKNISGTEPEQKKYQFTADGFFFNLNATGCEVTYESTAYASYRGPEIVTPATVAYDGQDYAVTAIGKSAFADCRLIESLTVSEGVTKLGQYAASGCLGLTTVSLPSTLEAVNSACFRYCDQISTVYCYSTVPPTASTKTIFHNSAYDGTLYVPAATRAAYAAATAWKEFAHILEMEDAAITLAPTSPAASSALYDLQGRRILTPTPGLYIQNGRKVMVK